MKLYTIEKKNKLSAAWLGFDGDRLLIKEKLERFPKHQTGCLKCFGA
jgi:hypothetical protein